MILPVQLSIEADFVSREEFDAHVTAAHPPTVREHNSGDLSERVTSISVTDGTTESVQRKVIFSIELPDLAMGEVLQAQADWQVTNDLGFDVMVQAQIVLGALASSTSGFEITEANGGDVTPAVHHGKMVNVGSHTVTDNSKRFLNLVARAQSTASTSASDSITVDADYGRLSVIRFT